MSKKNDYEQGREQGQKDANRTKGAIEITHDAIWPGRLPSEKSNEYQKGYNEGKNDAKKSK
jgi:hypothetical protein